MNNLINPVSDYISNKWVLPKRSSFFQREVMSRLGYGAIVAPMSGITAAIDTILGLGASLAAAATLGTHHRTNEFAFYHLSISNTILANPYKFALLGLNPHAKVKDEGDNCGFISGYVIGALAQFAQDSYELGSNMFIRQVVSRLTYAVALVASIVTRVADAIIGVAYGILSFVTLGKFETINSVAFRALQAPGVISDIILAALFCLNPYRFPAIKNLSPLEIVKVNTEGLDAMLGVRLKQPTNKKEDIEKGTVSTDEEDEISDDSSELYDREIEERALPLIKERVGQLTEEQLIAVYHSYSDEHDVLPKYVQTLLSFKPVKAIEAAENYDDDVNFDAMDRKQFNAILPKIWNEKILRGISDKKRAELDASTLWVMGAERVYWILNLDLNRPYQRFEILNKEAQNVVIEMLESSPNKQHRDVVDVLAPE